MKKFYLYRFLDKHKRIIYIGRTRNLDSRIKTHFNGGHLTVECYEDVEFIEVAELNNEADMYILEIYLISKYNPKYNTEYINMKCSLNLEEPVFNPYNRVIKAQKPINKDRLDMELKQFDMIRGDNVISIARDGNLSKRIKVQKGTLKIQLTNRDMCIIEFLLKNPNTDTCTIHKSFFSNSSLRTCQARIKLLVEVGLISCVRENLLSQNMYFVSVSNGEKYKRILTDLDSQIDI